MAVTSGKFAPVHTMRAYGGVKVQPAHDTKCRKVTIFLFHYDLLGHKDDMYTYTGGCGDMSYPSQLTDPRHTSDRGYEIFHITYTFLILVHIWKIVHLFKNSYSKSCVKCTKKPNIIMFISAQLSVFI